MQAPSGWAGCKRCLVGPSASTVWQPVAHCPLPIAIPSSCLSHRHPDSLNGSSGCNPGPDLEATCQTPKCGLQWRRNKDSCKSKGKGKIKNTSKSKMSIRKSNSSKSKSNNGSIRLISLAPTPP